MSSRSSLSEFEGLEPIDDNEPDNLFLTSASFEQRASAAIENLSDDYRATNGVIYINTGLLTESDSRTSRILNEMERKLKGHCDEVYIAEGSRENQADQLSAIKDSISTTIPENNKESSITIDSTTFTRETLQLYLSMLYNRKPKSRTRILYITPQEHGAWLTRGHQTIRNILGFTGLHKSHKPTTLIVLSGFESHRAMKVIEEFEPSKLMLGMGNPPTQERFLERNRQTKQIIEKTQDFEEFQFPTKSIEGAFNIVDSLIKRYTPTHNIVVAPMSTKLSTIGTWKAARLHNEVQVTYSIPGEYNKRDYSKGTDSIFIEELGL